MYQDSMHGLHKWISHWLVLTKQIAWTYLLFRFKRTPSNKFVLELWRSLPGPSSTPLVVLTILLEE
jgi:hypothetical protein